MRRGSFLSRLVALVILASPFLIAGGILARPLYDRWAAEGADILQFRARNIALARDDVHVAEIEALATEWRSFAADPRSGLAQNALAGTYQAVIAQTQQTLEAFNGTFTGAEMTGPLPLGGLEIADIVVRGDLPSDQLAAFLAAFETATPQLVLNMMQAEAPTGRRSAAPRLEITLGGRLHRLAAPNLQLDLPALNLTLAPPDRRLLETALQSDPQPQDPPAGSNQEDGE